MAAGPDPAWPCPAGGSALYLLVRSGLDLPEGPFPVSPVPLLGAAATAMVMILANRAEARVYDISLHSRFFSANGAEVSVEGVAILAPDSRWQTGWADVGSLSRGATATALDDAASGDAVSRAMVEWHGAAARVHG